MRSKKYESIAFGFIILVCLAAVGWFFYSTGSFITPTTTTVKPADTSILTTDFNALLKDRISFPEQNPISQDQVQTGRADPFAPY